MTGAVSALAVILFCLLVAALAYIWYLRKKKNQQNAINELNDTTNTTIQLPTQALGTLKQNDTNSVPQMDDTAEDNPIEHDQQNDGGNFIEYQSE